MRIIIEEHKYAATDVKDVLKGIDALENVEGYVCVNYVGYFYNTDKDVRDCVFILPKVLLEDVDASVMWVLYSSGSSALSGVDSGGLVLLEAVPSLSYAGLLHRYLQELIVQEVEPYGEVAGALRSQRHRHRGSCRRSI